MCRVNQGADEARYLYGTVTSHPNGHGERNCTATSTTPKAPHMNGGASTTKQLQDSPRAVFQWQVTTGAIYSQIFHAPVFQAGKFGTRLGIEGGRA